MDKKKVIMWTIAILLLFYVVSQPHDAAGTAHDILDALKGAAKSFIVFLKGVFN